MHRARRTIKAGDCEHQSDGPEAEHHFDFAQKVQKACTMRHRIQWCGPGSDPGCMRVLQSVRGTCESAGDEGVSDRQEKDQTGNQVERIGRNARLQPGK